MVRKAPPPNPKLIALLDQRDELQVQLSLALQSRHRSPGEIEALQARFRALEREIDVQKRFRGKG